jgi:hypothetical protein
MAFRLLGRLSSLAGAPSQTRLPVATAVAVCVSAAASCWAALEPLIIRLFGSARLARSLAGRSPPLERTSHSLSRSPLTRAIRVRLWPSKSFLFVYLSSSCTSCRASRLLWPSIGVLGSLLAAGQLVICKQLLVVVVVVVVVFCGAVWRPSKSILSFCCQLACLSSFVWTHARRARSTAPRVVRATLARHFEATGQNSSDRRWNLFACALV